MQHYLRKNSLVRPFCKESSISFASFGPTLWRVHHFLSHTKAKRSVRARCAKTTPPPPPVLSAKQKTTLSLFRRLAFFLRVGVGAFKTIYIYYETKWNEMKWCGLRRRRGEETRDVETRQTALSAMRKHHRRRLPPPRVWRAFSRPRGWSSWGSLRCCSFIRRWWCLLIVKVRMMMDRRLVRLSHEFTNEPPKLVLPTSFLRLEYQRCLRFLLGILK